MQKPFMNQSEQLDRTFTTDISQVELRNAKPTQALNHTNKQRLTRFTTASAHQKPVKTHH